MLFHSWVVIVNLVETSSFNHSFTFYTHRSSSSHPIVLSSSILIFYILCKYNLVSSLTVTDLGYRHSTLFPKPRCAESKIYVRGSVVFLTLTFPPLCRIYTKMKRIIFFIPYLFSSLNSTGVRAFTSDPPRQTCSSHMSSRPPVNGIHNHGVDVKFNVLCIGYYRIDGWVTLRLQCYCKTVSEQQKKVLYSYH